MSDPSPIQSAGNEDLVSELEAREKKNPLAEGLKERLANLAGAVRPKVQIVIPLVTVVKEPPTAIDTAKEARELSLVAREALFVTLQSRFETFPERHKGVEWSRVKDALGANKMALWSIQKLEENGGEPDVFRADQAGFEIGDCSAESPAVRRNCVYDSKAEVSARNIDPNGKIDGNAIEKAFQWGVKLMSREQYEYLQTVGRFDSVIQSMLETSDEMMRDGGVLCGFLCPSGVYIGRGDILEHREDRAFRCALKVKWVEDKSKQSLSKKLNK